MRIHEGIPCYYVCHTMFNGNWKVEPSFVDTRNRLNVIHKTIDNEYISVYLDEISPVDALAKGYELITNYPD